LVIDLSGRLPGDLRLFDGSTPTVVFTRKRMGDRKNLRFVLLPENRDLLEFIAEFLYQSEIQSLIVEGGASLLRSFIEKDLWDEARVFTGDSSFGKGVKAPVLQQDPLIEQQIPSGVLKMYRKT
jgi:diaminohydroxyphosphoribosylaminopyrimidine deaminase/5-amino-6-(5-phosphoribosylamino)uracil reductase